MDLKYRHIIQNNICIGIDQLLFDGVNVHSLIHWIHSLVHSLNSLAHYHI